MQNTWIFQLRDSLSASQQAKIEAELGPFVRDAWKAHGAPVPGELEIRYDRFVIIRAEPGSTSGCSIDSMTKTASRILEDAGAEKLEANFVFFKDENGNIEFIDFREIPLALQSGRISAETPVFQTAIQPGESFDKFEQPLKNTWMSRYLRQQA